MNLFKVFGIFFSLKAKEIRKEASYFFRYHGKTVLYCLLIYSIFWGVGFGFTQMPKEVQKFLFWHSPGVQQTIEQHYQETQVEGYQPEKIPLRVTIILRFIGIPFMGSIITVMFLIVPLILLFFSYLLFEGLFRISKKFGGWILDNWEQAKKIAEERKNG